jgi:flagellar hook assembly protein FlgD
VIRAALPVGAGGGASVRIYNVAGERVRTLDLGNLSGGAYYYQAWDGRNDGGRDAATGVYLGVLKVGGRTKTFKMALIK